MPAALARKRIKEDSLEIDCPLCGAKINRGCVNTTRHSQGILLREPHQARMDRYLKEEFRSHRTLASIPYAKIKNLFIRSHATGRYGRVIYAGGNSNVLIKWDNGSETSFKHPETDKVLEWKEPGGM